MAYLKTNYVDDVLDASVNDKRKYNMIQNADGTVSFDDVTTYTQNGDSFGAKDVNDTNTAVNVLNENLAQTPITKGDVTLSTIDEKLNYIIENGGGKEQELYFTVADKVTTSPVNGYAIVQTWGYSSEWGVSFSGVKVNDVEPEYLAVKKYSTTTSSIIGGLAIFKVNVGDEISVLLTNSDWRITYVHFS